jgi:putative hemolysin
VTVSRQQGGVLTTIILCLGIFCLTSCNPTPETASEDCGEAAIANPASVYCGLLGYDHELVDTDTGTAGMCTFPDGATCEEWEFLTGKCGAEHSYCAQQGYGIKTLSDGNNPYSSEYAVCVDDQGGVTGSVSELSGLEDTLSPCP